MLPFHRRELTGNSGNSIREIDRPLDPPGKLVGGRIVRINDRVETAHGLRTVIEISNDRYLIALDGQEGIGEIEVS